MFDNLFVHMGPAGAALALGLVVLLPALIALVATLELARPSIVAAWQLRAERAGTCFAVLLARRLR